MLVSRVLARLVWGTVALETWGLGLKASQAGACWSSRRAGARQEPLRLGGGLQVAWPWGRSG